MSRQTGPERVELAGPRSGSSPLTPLVTLGSPHFLMALSYPAIKARDQTARPREREIMGRTRRTCGSRGTLRPLARKLLKSLAGAKNVSSKSPCFSRSWLYMLTICQDKKCFTQYTFFWPPKISLEQSAPFLVDGHPWPWSQSCGS